MRVLTVALVLICLLTAPALACGPGGTTRGMTGHMPPIAVGLDRYDKDAALSDADRAKIKVLRVRIDELVKAKKEDEARKVEEEAMAILGYRKAYMPCGAGSFIWMKTIKTS
jgi:hypothetical protein